MAFQRFLPKTLALTSSSVFSRSFFTSTRTSASYSADSSVLSLIRRLRPLTVAAHFQRVPASNAVRSLSTRATSSSLNDPNPNWSNRPPKETILLDGCDFEHWLVVMEKPEGEPTRDEIIDSYIKTLAMVVGRCYFAFGALVSEELSYKIKELPRVRWVLPDSYLDVKNKDYGGEPFIDGQAVPYDPKYHEEWIRNNARANERNRRNDRPRNFDRSRNFERRRENMQNRDFQNPSPAMQNPGLGHAPNMSGAPPNMSGMPPNNMAGVPPNNMGMGGVPPSSNYGRMPPSNLGGVRPPHNMAGGTPYPHNMGGVGTPHIEAGGPPYPHNMDRGPPSSMGDVPPYNYGGGMPQHNRLNMPPPHNFGVHPNNMGGATPNFGAMPTTNTGGMPSNTGPVTEREQPNGYQARNFSGENSYSC